MPLPANPLTVPPAAVTSVAVKVADASERVKVSCAVCPARRVPEAFDVMVTVGATPRLNEVAALPLPAASLNELAAMFSSTLPVKPVVGANVAL